MTDAATPLPDITGALVRRALAIDPATLPDSVSLLARQCLLDWIGVALAARAEPVAAILIDTVFEDGGEGPCMLIGQERTASVSQAALVNGTLGHALDYDDVNEHVGHPSATIAPVVLALGERLGATGAEVIAALVAGYEIATTVGRHMGGSHYARGFHSTATIGVFGAATAAARLLGLDADQFRHALGIAGTQAAGLKAVFGTMTKPLHAGLAARAGILAAQLAGRGMTSHPALLEAPNGFGAVLSDDFRVVIDEGEGAQWAITRNLFKYHACCYLTHSAIEAIGEIRARTPFSPDEVETVDVIVSPMHMGVCTIVSPKTGLELKFSLRMLCALAMQGAATSDLSLYSDAVATRADLVRLGERVTIMPSSRGARAEVRIALRSGAILESSYDVAIPEIDLARQQGKLEAKFRTLVAPDFDGDALLRAVNGLHHAPNLGGLTRLLRV